MFICMLISALIFIFICMESYLYAHISMLFYAPLGVHPAEQGKLFVILSPVGPYFKSGFRPVKLYADTEYVRAWPGGAGNAKVGILRLI